MTCEQTIPEIRFIEGQFQRVSLGPTDVIVFTCPGPLSQQAACNIKDLAQQTFGPDRKIIVLPKGVTMGAMGAGEYSALLSNEEEDK